MQEPENEKRRSPRYGARVRVLYFSKGQPRAVDADCENISTEGLFVKTRRRGPEKGTPVSLILQFEGSQKEHMVEGVVRWQGEVQTLDNGTEGAGMGIEFTELDTSLRAELQATLSNLPGDP